MHNSAIFWVRAKRRSVWCLRHTFWTRYTSRKSILRPILRFGSFLRENAWKCEFCFFRPKIFEIFCSYFCPIRTMRPCCFWQKFSDFRPLVSLVTARYVQDPNFAGLRFVCNGCKCGPAPSCGCGDREGQVKISKTGTGRIQGQQSCGGQQCPGYGRYHSSSGN